MDAAYIQWMPSRSFPAQLLFQFWSRLGDEDGGGDDGDDDDDRSDVD